MREIRFAERKVHVIQLAVTYQILYNITNWANVHRKLGDAHGVPSARHAWAG